MCRRLDSTIFNKIIDDILTPPYFKMTCRKILGGKWFNAHQWPGSQKQPGVKFVETDINTQIKKRKVWSGRKLKPEPSQLKQTESQQNDYYYKNALIFLQYINLVDSVSGNNQMWPWKHQCFKPYYKEIQFSQCVFSKAWDSVRIAKEYCTSKMDIKIYTFQLK